MNAMQKHGASALALLALLAAAGAALPEGQLPNALEYTAGELRLRGTTLAPQELTDAANTARASGYSLRADGDSLLVRPDTTP